MLPPDLDNHKGDHEDSSAKIPLFGKKTAPLWWMGFGMLGQGRVEVLSAGSAPKDSINPIAVEAMAELGIDIANNTPKILTPEAVQASDAVVTMGCGDACPFYPGKRYEDWVLDDPAGQGIESVRVIRDDIKARVEKLLAELLT